MAFDLAFLLLVASLVSGCIWAADAWIYRPRRERRFEAARLAAAGEVTRLEGSKAKLVESAETDSAAATREPVIVEYARSFFPVLVIVLIVRSFLFEPFRIPSSSMMPTLLVGDFIFVNKFVYGLRLPVLNSKVLETGEPARGDVVVFRLPSDPSTNYIKRVVGLPGDQVRYRSKRLFVNGEPVPVEQRGVYSGRGQPGARLGREQLGETEHDILVIPGRFGREGEWIVPEGHYFMMGDNRDNSRDSRYAEVSVVPESRLVGKAVRIWMNWDWSSSAPLWSRIGDKIN